MAPQQLPTFPLKERIPDLDLSMSPANCYKSHERPYAATAAKKVIQETAMNILEYEKLPSFWKHKSDDTETFKWFISRLTERRLSTPTNSRPNSLRNQTPSKLSPRSSRSASPAKRGLTERIPLQQISLAEFQDLYIVVCVKLREMYRDLQLRLKNGFLEKTAAITSSEQNFMKEYEDMTVDDLVTMIRVSWRNMMEPGLVLALDIALKEKQHTLTGALYPDCRGLPDINHLPPASLVAEIWHKHGAAVKAEIEEEERMSANEAKMALHMAPSSVPEQSEDEEDIKLVQQLMDEGLHSPGLSSAKHHLRQHVELSENWWVSPGASRLGRTFEKGLCRRMGVPVPPTTLEGGSSNVPLRVQEHQRSKSHSPPSGPSEGRISVSSDVSDSPILIRKPVQRLQTAPTVPTLSGRSIVPVFGSAEPDSPVVIQSYYFKAKSARESCEDPVPDPHPIYHMTPPTATGTFEMSRKALYNALDKPLPAPPSDDEEEEYDAPVAYHAAAFPKGGRRVTVGSMEKPRKASVGRAFVRKMSGFVSRKST
ncbi:hypothetical protein M501DRAFT_1017607 [Patellaria atrata CBS 101060]|uniref:Uncharacterized protein n=1 Tax=Patellaria atrata CBS 101060 TaxID=1346257 RepID=A0A9P4VQI3_9PEZI|nr:hypothetical protein M501DRAFT_1017607 [Patellaria atrata CBS 101060]